MVLTLKMRLMPLALIAVSALVLIVAYQFQLASQEVDIGPANDQSFVGTGFSGPEVSPSTDINYRWTTDEHSYLALYQLGAPYQVNFRAFSASPNQQSVAVTVLVNGRELGQVKVGSQPQYFQLNSLWPQLDFQDLLVEFRVSKVATYLRKNASQLTPAGDPLKMSTISLTQPVGIAVDWVKTSTYRTSLGLLIPPPVQVLWWLLIVWGPLLVVRLSLSQSWKIHRVLIHRLSPNSDFSAQAFTSPTATNTTLTTLPRQLIKFWMAGINLIVVTNLLIWPSSFNFLKIHWFITGLGIALLEFVGWHLNLYLNNRRRVLFEMALVSATSPNSTDTPLNSSGTGARARLVRQDGYSGISNLNGWLLLLALALFYLASARGRLSYGDDHLMEAETAAIVSGNPTAPLTNFSNSPEITTFGKYGIGLSLVAVPFYLLGEVFTRLLPSFFSDVNGKAGLAVYILMLTELVVTVGSVWLFYKLLRMLRFSVLVSLITVGCYAVGTMAWHYARTFMSEPLVGFCLLAAIIGLLKYRENITNSTGWRWACLSGFMVGLSVATRLPNLVLVPLFGIFALWLWWSYYYSHSIENVNEIKTEIEISIRSRLNQGKALRQRELKRLLVAGLAWSVPLVGWVMLISWYNFARFGSFTTTGYNSQQEGFNTPFLTGFYGLVFSPGKSLFVYNPVLLFGLIGFLILILNRITTANYYRRSKQQQLLALAVLSLTAGGAYLLIYSPWDQWFGGGVWGPRFLLPIVPLLLWPAAIPLNWLVKIGQSQDQSKSRGRDRLLRQSVVSSRRCYQLLLGLVSLICTVSVGVQVLSVWVDYEIYEARYKDQWQSQLFYNAVHNPIDSPIAVHFKLWSEGIYADLAPHFYQNTPFARWVSLIQGSSLLLTISLVVLVVLKLLNNRLIKLTNEVIYPPDKSTTDS